METINGRAGSRGGWRGAWAEGPAARGNEGRKDLRGSQEGNEGDKEKMGGGLTEEGVCFYS